MVTLLTSKAACEITGLVNNVGAYSILPDHCWINGSELFGVHVMADIWKL